MKKLSFIPILISPLVLAGCSFFDNFRAPTSSSQEGSSASSSSSSYKSEAPRKYYRVNFYDYDAKTVLYSTEVPSGDTPKYVGSNPVKPEGEKRRYTFQGWDKEIGPISANTDYYPLFQERLLSYTVTFYDGRNPISTQQLAFGDPVNAPSFSPTYYEDKTFVGWDVDLNNLKCAGDLEIHALYETIPFGLYFNETSYISPVDNKTYRGYSVTSYEGSSESVSIPDTYNGKPVIGIEGNCFHWSSTLKRVFLPDSVKYISAWAFEGCQNLNQISFGSGLEKIGTNAFQECSALETVVFQEGLYSIAERAFANSGIVTLGLPASVQELGQNVFAECHNLIRVDLSKVTVPLSVGMFNNASALKEVILNDGLTSLPARLFQYCSTLEEIHFPESLKEIGDRCFASCSKIKTVTIPEGIEIIGEGAFYYCGALTKVDLPESLTTIRANAFSECTSLSEMTVGDHILSLGSNFIGMTPIYNDANHLFSSLYYLRSRTGEAEYIYRVSENMNYADQKIPFSRLSPRTKTIVDGLSFTQDTIAVPTALCEDLTFLKSCTFYDLVLEGGDRYSVADGCIYEGDALYRCFAKTLNTIRVKEGTTRITSFAFRDLGNVEEVVLNEGLKEIDANAFTDCYLSTLALPTSVERVSRGVFGGNNSSSYILNPEGYSPLYDEGSTFPNYLNVYSHYDGVQGIEDGIHYFVNDGKAVVYRYSRNLRYISFPEKVGGYVIAEFAPYFRWDDSYNVRAIELPASLQKLGRYAMSAFASDTNLASVTVPSTLKSIGVGGLALGGGTAVIPSAVSTLAYGSIYCQNAKILISGSEVPKGYDTGFAQGSYKIYFYSENPIYDDAHWHYVGGDGGEKMPVIYTQE